MATYRLPTEEQIQARFAAQGMLAAAKPAPTVTSVTPSSGNIVGGTSVVIAGTNLTGASSVKFGTTAATNVVVNSATQIHATAPAHAAGAVSVTVTTGNGTSATNSLYTYVTYANSFAKQRQHSGAHGSNHCHTEQMHSSHGLSDHACGRSTADPA